MDFFGNYRAAKQTDRFVNQQDVLESEELQFFLATRSALLGNVKKSLESISGFEDLLGNVIALCVSMYETQGYLLPAEKRGLVEVMDHT